MPRCLIPFRGIIYIAGIASAIGMTSVVAQTMYGRVSEAYGNVVGMYTGGLVIAEVCSEYPKLKTEAEDTSRNYLASNSALYNAVGQKMQSIALTQGGPSALEKLRREVREHLADQEALKREARQTASSEATCRTLLQNLRRGYWDLKTKAQPQIDLIMKQ